MSINVSLQSLQLHAVSLKVRANWIPKWWQCGEKEEESQQGFFFLIPHVRLPINALIIINSHQRSVDDIDAVVSHVVKD